VRQGAGSRLPPPPVTIEEAFGKLITPQGKKEKTPPVPKFIKKLDSISKITLSEEQPINIALALEERGLVGQFMGL